MMLRKLEEEEIKMFSTRKDVVEYAVENFLRGVQGHSTVLYALSDMVNDAIERMWDDQTICAIADGIFLAGGVVT